MDTNIIVAGASSCLENISVYYIHIHAHILNYIPTRVVYICVLLMNIHDLYVW